MLQEHIHVDGAEEPARAHRDAQSSRISHGRHIDPRQRLDVRNGIGNGNRACEWSPPPVRKDDRMENSHLGGLSVYASGVYPVELSVGKRINGHHRIPMRASVEVSTGEVRFYVDPDGIEILRFDTDGD